MITVPTTSRVLINAPLQPLQGRRFQPTGFPDLGPATYDSPTDDGQGTVPMLLLESAQSVANRLEVVCLDADGDLVPTLRGLPFVRVDAPDGPMTSSLSEAHRLNSPYIENATWNGVAGGFKELLTGEIGYQQKRPFNFKKFAAALFKYDPSSLVHGCFMESIAGVLRVPRMLGGFIEAEDVRRVPYGGVKNDRVMPKTEGSKLKAKDGYGNVPFHREDFTAARITAYFNIDLVQLRNYGLGAEAEALLFALSCWKIRKFLEGGLRLRTACDLDLDGDLVIRGVEGVPNLAELEDALPGLIESCASSFARPRVTIVQHND